MAQGQTAQKIFAFDEGDVWRHPGHFHTEWSNSCLQDLASQTLHALALLNCTPNSCLPLSVLAPSYKNAFGCWFYSIGLVEAYSQGQPNWIEATAHAACVWIQVWLARAACFNQANGVEPKAIL